MSLHDVNFDIMEQILDDHRMTNIYQGGIIDVQRMLTLWDMIVEENDSQLSLLSDPEEKKKWENMKNNYNNRIAAAENPTHIALIFSDIVNSLQKDPISTTDGGVRRGNILHVKKSHFQEG